MTYTPLPYNLSHALENQYFMSDLDDLPMYLNEGILYAILKDWDAAKCREDRLIQMNEKLAQKVEELTQQQAECSSTAPEVH